MFLCFKLKICDTNLQAAKDYALYGVNRCCPIQKISFAIRYYKIIFILVVALYLCVVLYL